MRPLLKWAGGKRQLLAHFRRFYPATFHRYFEPFLGSGAVFFDLRSAGRLDGRPVHLTDSNADLIACYTAVRDEPDAVVAALRRLEAGHRRDGAAHYYRVRERFNACRRARTARDAARLAAMLIYLNRTGYNGLFRLNAAGDFNVPVGRYHRPKVCDPELVRAVADALANVTLRSCPFEDAIGGARAGDLLYFDPPYEPISSTSAFGAYTAGRFSTGDQARLCEAVIDLAARGCGVMLSNSSAARIEQLYRTAATEPSAGLTLWRVPARRVINSRGTGRGYIAELLLTNLGPRPAGARDEVVRVA